MQNLPDEVVDELVTRMLARGGDKIASAVQQQIMQAQQAQQAQAAETKRSQRTESHRQNIGNLMQQDPEYMQLISKRGLAPEVALGLIDSLWSKGALAAPMLKHILQDDNSFSQTMKGLENRDPDALDETFYFSSVKSRDEPASATSVSAKPARSSASSEATVSSINASIRRIRSSC